MHALSMFEVCLWMLCKASKEQTARLVLAGITKKGRQKSVKPIRTPNKQGEKQERFIDFSNLPGDKCTTILQMR